MDLDELERVATGNNVSSHTVLCKRAEQAFETPINKLKVKRTSSILQITKNITTDEETEFRDGDVITAHYAKLNKTGSSSSFSMLSKSKSLSNITKAMSNFGIGSPPSSGSSISSSFGTSPSSPLGSPLSHSPRTSSVSNVSTSPRTTQGWPASSSQPRAIPTPPPTLTTQPPKKASKSKPVSLLRQLLNQ
jgi:hypothetical protein